MAAAVEGNERGARNAGSAALTALSNAESPSSRALMSMVGTASSSSGDLCTPGVDV
jgi:hypothetical protein